MNAAESIQQPGTPEICLSCGSPAVLKGFPNALCESCREGFIKYPIPLWIKIFAGAIGVILLFSLYKIPQNISLGMHLDKGETAMQEKKYMSAEKELKKAMKNIPGNLEMQSNLLIASFYNVDFKVFDSMMHEVGSRQFEDQDLYDRVKSVVDASAFLVPSADYDSLASHYNNDFSLIPDTTVKNYISSNPSDIYVQLLLAGTLSDKKQYAAADLILKGVLQQDGQNFAGLQMLSSNKRMESQFDSSLYYCDILLNINKESVYALSSKSRTFLKQKKDKEALEYAEKSIALDKDNYYAEGSLALAYHFTNNSKGCDELLHKMSAAGDPESEETLQYVKNVISGKEKFRN